MIAVGRAFGGHGSIVLLALALGLNAIAGCKRSPNSGDRPDAGAALAPLRARAAAKDLPGAEAEAAKLAGRPEEAEARALVAELYITLGHPRGGEQAARATDWLAARGEHARAAQTARLQARPAWMASRYQEALAALERSRQEADRAGDALLAGKALLGEFLILYELGDLRSAGAVLGKAEQKAAAADVDTRALVALNRGLLSDAEGNKRSARAAFERALALVGDKPKSEVAWSSSLNLLELALTARDLPWATQAHTAAQPRFEAGFKQRAHSRLAWGYYSAQLELLRGQPQAALDRLQAIAGEPGNQNWDWKLALERGRALEALGRWQPAAAAYEQAVAGVEGLRGEQPDQHRSWVLAQRRAPFIALFELHVRQGAVAKALEALERTQGRMFLEAFSAQTAGLTGEGPNFAPAARRAEALKQLYPALRSSALIAAAPLPWTELRKRLRRDHVVAFFEASARLYAISARRGQVRIHPIDRPPDELRKLVGQFLARPDDTALADTLGRLLFPAAALPPPGERLLVAPSGLLGRVPFGALRVDGQYLTQRSVVVQIPSLNALVALRGLPPEPAIAPLVLADPQGDLPAAETEALVVAARLGPAAQVLVGARATSEGLRRPGRASLLHLALHSGVDAAGPWLGLHDRRVAAGEILNWRVRADVVLLSSCASAATPDPGLWGSLAASFLAAGSRSVVGALWSTRDEVNRRFVEDFYAADGPRDPAGALARTQQAWIARGRPAAEWAGYAFFGAGPLEESGDRALTGHRTVKQAPCAEGD